MTEPTKETKKVEVTDVPGTYPQLHHIAVDGHPDEKPAYQTEGAHGGGMGAFTALKPKPEESK